MITTRPRYMKRFRAVRSFMSGISTGIEHVSFQKDGFFSAFLLHRVTICACSCLRQVDSLFRCRCLSLPARFTSTCPAALRRRRRRYRTGRAIAPPRNPLPDEPCRQGHRILFIVYGDTRGRRDGVAEQYEHSLIVDSALATITRLLRVHTGKVRPADWRRGGEWSRCAPMEQ